MSICHATSIECWLRSGWAMDFFLASVTREHKDIDLFVWAKDASTLVRGLQGAGFAELGGPPPEAQRDFSKDGKKCRLRSLIGISAGRSWWQVDRGQVARGPTACSTDRSGGLVNSSAQS